MNRILSMISAVALILAATGCSDDPVNDEAVIYNIVRLESQDNDGAVFSFRKPSADHDVTLTSPPVIDTETVPAGDRLLLAYVPLSGESYQSGPVTVKAYRPINNASMTEGNDADFSGWDADPIYLLSAWRSREYLNLHARLPYDPQPRRLALVRDVDSDPSYPDLYLVHQLSGDIETFDRAYYISFDISQLTSSPDVDGFTLHLNDSNLELKAIRFSLD